MATYVNNLRLTELATGEGSGTWGTTTNTSLELIGEALGYNTQNCFSSDADATTTVADGASDPARSFYFKVTSSATLTATRTLTIAPNTLSRVMFIENATTGSQSIAISQGSGANVTIATGRTAVVYLDGAGSGAAVVDAMANVDPGITDTLAEVLVAGNTSGGTGLTMSSGDDLTLTGASYNVVWDSSDSALEFADNAKATFGGSQDLQIYHDGSASYIDDAGTGNLRIRANSSLSIQKYTGETMGVFTADGSVLLAHDNVTRLETTSTGIDVTGTAVMDALTVGGTLGNFDISAGGNQATFDYNGFNYINSTGAGSALVVRMGSGSTNAIRFDSDGKVIINDDGNDTDFRVESDGASHMLFVDAGNNRVGIGESSPDTPLHITTSSSGNVITLESTDAGTAAGPSINLFRNSSSPANNDLGPAIFFRGDNSVGGSHTYANIFTQYTDVTDGAEDANVMHQISIAGQNRTVLGLTTSEVTINDESQDVDFRVESNNSQYAVYVDAAQDSVGILTNATDAALNVNSQNASKDAIRIVGSGGNNFIAGYGNQGNLSFTIAEVGADDPGILTLYRNGIASHIITTDESSETVFNEQGDNLDFRIESDNNANMLFVDAGNDRVGVGGAPSSPFHVQSGTTNNVATFTSTDSTAVIMMQDNSGNSQFGTSGNTARISPNSSYAVFEASQTAVVINNAAQDTDFRVESDNQANMLFVDAGNDRVGIAESAPESQLHIKQTADIGTGDEMGLMIESGTSTQRYMLQTGRAGVSNAHFNLRDVSNSRDIWSVFDTDGTFQGHTPFQWNNAAVFNEGSQDYDFRVESAGNENMLFVDASANAVAVGHNTPLVPLHVQSTGSGEIVRIESTNADASQGPILALYRNSSSPADNDGIGRINFLGEDSAGNQTTYNYIASTITDVSNGTEDSKISIGVLAGGAARSAFILDGGTGATFNEDGIADGDFRVESDSNSSMLVVDAGSNYVDIGGAGNIGGQLNIIGSEGIRGKKDATYKTATMVQPTGWGYSVGTYAVTQLGDQSTQGTVSIGYDPSANTDGSFSGTGIEMLFAGDMHFYQPNSADTGWKRQLRMINTSGVIINENSEADLDFRVESDSNANMLFVDAGNNRVGVGMSAPDSTLEVNGTVNINGIYHTEATQTFLTASTANDLVSVAFGSAQIGVYVKIKYRSAKNDGGVVSHVAGEELFIFRSDSTSPAVATTSTNTGSSFLTFTTAQDTGNNKLTVKVNPGAAANFADITYTLEVIPRNVGTTPTITHL